MKIFRRFALLITALTMCLISTVTASDQVKAATSASEFEWQLKTGTPPDSYWYAITYGEGLFVAVGADYDDPDGAEIVTSSDGVTWTPAQPLPGIHEFWSVAYGNGIFVATGIEYSNNWNTLTNVTAVSQDGITWTKTSMQSTKSLQVAFGEGVFVAVSDKDDTNSSNQILTSTDGINWLRYADLPGSQKWSRIAHCDGKFIAVSTAFNVITSADGTSWTPQTSPTFDFTPQASDSNAMALACGDGKFVLLSSVNNNADMNEAAVTAHVSADGATWTRVQINNTSENWLVLSFDGSSFVGTYGDRTLVSQDGENWTSSPIIHGGRWMGLTYQHGLYVAVDDYGKIMTSGVFAPPTEETPTSNETVVAPTTTTMTAAATTTVTAKVKKQNTLPETGSGSSTPLLIGSLLVAGGLVIALRRRIAQ